MTTISEQAAAVILKEIEGINLLKNRQDRIDAMIKLKEKAIAEINDSLDDIFADVELKQPGQ